ncbi:MAG TPA: TPM domain-containing protein [Thiobacillaceae bacterium]|nr:TPM domain-containing protein [Thiobacillaceae bacterium]
MVAIARFLKHLFLPGWWSHRRFPEACMARIEAAIAESERGHHGEICFAVETTLDMASLLRGRLARERALEVFAEQRLWDTEANNGVLIYLLLADRDVEIVADRGVAARVDQAEWQTICQRMESDFRAGAFEAGVLRGIADIDAHLVRLYSRADRDVNELPNRPIRL